MTLSIDERKAVVTLRLENSRETLREVENILALGYWRTAANRLYYACYYAVCALLIQNGYVAKTHAGVIKAQRKI